MDDITNSGIKEAVEKVGEGPLAAATLARSAPKTDDIYEDSEAKESSMLASSEVLIELDDAQLIEEIAQKSGLKKLPEKFPPEELRVLHRVMVVGAGAAEQHNPYLRLKRVKQCQK